MAIFTFEDKSSIGTVFSVDTATLIIKVDELEKLRKLQVNHLVAIQSSKAGQHLIGIINRITRKASDEEQPAGDDLGLTNFLFTENILKVNLIGTLLNKHGEKENVFKRTLDTVPEIEAKCFPIDGENITKFMQTISTKENYEIPLSIGKYSIDENAEAFLDGDKLFQRHAVIVGSTGSGKSWCVAKIIEQIAKLPMANSILFDIHGEYSGADFKADGIQHFRIANPSDLGKKGNLANSVLMLPYWLLTYEEILAMLLDRSDSNAPNQAMLFSKTVFTEKQKYLDEVKDTVFKDSITIDSPVPYKIENVIEELIRLDEEMVAGAKVGTEKQGPFFGKLTRFIQRLEAKSQDKRLGFLFQISEDELQLDWLNDLCSALMHGSELNGKKSGVKIIDFSEVPSDVLPLVIGLVARIVFTVQQWTTKENQHPICLLCDEAHLYIPERTNQDSASELGLKSFERIAKEGRKYGVSLTVISQRPAEVNRTVLSQCNNFISLRLANAEDQAVIKRLLPDNLAGLTEVLPILDIGEALIVGDASLLPTRVLISEPAIKPDSATIKFWKEWSNKSAKQDIKNAVIGLRKQSKT
ncbi:Type IV secretory pathway, VirB4 components [Candidatus Ornithobacterium hominis]|uniref:Type IV secretory pathway, VirB4 components n=1 Tax=Candidatus Ornithobacterium hominis TaxID=2497989 RepID=A0A383U342_9FLAO|nr:ATP-binding protein [Candidatus Ornithobacterium hominis]MCT7905187.1 ATP-binding protein [Candidatus Ornithobacterium hominis]SZD74304.1 Type IV secretory pathway, VirB4 components [Candidatus Ornithobacterium hominis]